jgi:hypothetical protein
MGFSPHTPIETKSQRGTEMFLAFFHEKVFSGSIPPLKNDPIEKRGPFSDGL